MLGQSLKVSHVTVWRIQSDRRIVQLWGRHFDFWTKQQKQEVRVRQEPDCCSQLCLFLWANGGVLETLKLFAFSKEPKFRELPGLQILSLRQSLQRVVCLGHSQQVARSSLRYDFSGEKNARYLQMRVFKLWLVHDLQQLPVVQGLWATQMPVSLPLSFSFGRNSCQNVYSQTVSRSEL